jgi:hypothetical protein
MAVAYASSSTTTQATRSSCVMTKPTGLAVGDAMLFVWCSVDSGTVDSVPSGFTEVLTVAPSRVVSIWGKIADSGDVSAVSFTFGLSGSLSCGAILYRFTGTHQSNPFVASNGINTNNTSTPSFAAAITPTANCLLVISGLEDNAGSSIDITSYAITTSDPGSWIERLEAIRTDFQQVSFSATSAVRSQSTSTGNFTVTNTNGDFGNQWIGTIVAIQPPPATSIKTINGLAIGSVKTYNGLAIASVKTINGLP